MTIQAVGLKMRSLREVRVLAPSDIKAGARKREQESRAGAGGGLWPECKPRVMHHCLEVEQEKRRKVPRRSDNQDDLEGLG